MSVLVWSLPWQAWRTGPWLTVSSPFNGPSFYLAGFPGVSVVKNLPASAGDASSIPGSGRSPGEENGNPLQYSYVRNPMTEKSGGLQSMGCERVGYYLPTKLLSHGSPREMTYSVQDIALYCFAELNCSMWVANPWDSGEFAGDLQNHKRNSTYHLIW